MSESNGNELLVKQRIARLHYWMEERERVRELKEAGFPKPWSNDPTFQTVYFCNVNRENDRVTKAIRKQYSQYYSHPLFEVNIGFSRLINNAETLQSIGFIHSSEDFPGVQTRLEELAAEGKTVFGDAYIVSTNGRPVGKAYYVCGVLLPALYERVGPAYYPTGYPSTPSLSAAYEWLRGCYGIGSFMAGQILADLKNTPRHPLFTAFDRDTWCTHGPGSLRGANWIFDGIVKPSTFVWYLEKIREVLYDELGCEIVTDNQDLQNCLCEFDKFMRVSTGAGRSKRRYQGV